MVLQVVRSIFLLTILLHSVKADAQLSGTYTVPLSYTSIASAIADLNTQGVSGPVTIYVQAGYTETVASGGFSLSASGTSVNTITFQKEGTGLNPIITGYSGGTGTPGSSVQDGIWRMIGSDYITIDGIDLIDPNSTNPSTMEYGYGFFKAGTSNGCQNNTIRNCAITLSSVNNVSGAGPAVDGSRGINLVNSLATFQTSNLTPVSAAGSNSNNRFYGNTISHCNVGISMIGYVAPSPFTLADTGNDVGGLLSVQGNTISNFGGAPAATNAAAGIRTLAQQELNVSNNVINNNTGSGNNHVAALRGIFVNTALSANTTIKGNLISVRGAGTTVAVSAIENVSGATSSNNTITIQSNSITNCSNSNNTTNSFYGIFNNAASCTYLNINDNIFSNNITNATTGSNYLIYNTGAVTAAITITNNVFAACSNTATTSGAYYSIFNNAAATASLFANNNTFSVCSASAASGATHLIYNTGNMGGNIEMNNNAVGSCSYAASSSGAFYALYNNAASCSGLSISSNTLTDQQGASGSGASHFLYNRGALTNTQVTVDFLYNFITNCTFTSSSTGQFYMLWNNGVTNTLITIAGNTLSNLNWQTTANLRYAISNWGVGTTSISIANNLISSCTSTSNGTGSFFGLYNNNTSAVSCGTLSMINNTITGFNSTGTSGDLHYVNSSGVVSNTFANILIQDNLISNCSNTISGSGTFNGIYNNTASSQSLGITGNSVSAINLRTNSGAGFFFYNRGVAGSLFSEVSFGNNVMTAITHSGTASGAFNALLNTGPATSTTNLLTVFNNTLINCVSNSSTSAITAINNTAPVNTLISISGNLISQWTNTTTTSGVFSGIVNTGASSGGSLSISSNTLSDLNSTASTGIRYFIFNNAAINSAVDIQNNFISNNTHLISSSAALHFINNTSAASTQSVSISGNTLSANSATALNGATHLIINSGTATHTLNTVSISLNSVSDHSSTSTSGPFYGLYSTGVNCTSLSVANNSFNAIQLPAPANGKFLIQNNSPILSELVFSNNYLTSISASLNTSASIYAIYNSGSVAGNLSAIGNSISALQIGSTTGSVFPVYNSANVGNSLAMLNNLITGLTFTGNSSGSLFEICNGGNVGGTLSATGNTLSNQQLSTNSGPVIGILNSGAITNALDLNANYIANLSYSTNGAGIFSGISNSGISGNTGAINSNTFTGLTVAVNSASTALISNTGSISMNFLSNANTFTNSSISSSTGIVFVANNLGGVGAMLEMNNNALGNFSLASQGGISARGFNNSAPAASISISNNTVSALSGTGTFSNYFIIANTGTSLGFCKMEGNNISSLSNTGGNVSNMYGITNQGASTGFVSLSGNTFTNNSSMATSGDIFHIHNSAAVMDSISIANNFLSQSFSNPGVAFSGNCFSIYNTGGSITGSLSIRGNEFSGFLFNGPNGTGDLTFIYNTTNNADFRVLANRWNALVLKHDAAQTLILNTSSTQGVLSVSANSIVSGYTRTGSAGPFSLYQSGSNLSPTGAQFIVGNSFTGITATVQGNGSFCGICSIDSCAQKTISDNVISNVNYSAVGFAHGYLLDHLGNGASTAPSVVSNNVFSNVRCAGPLFGLRINAGVSGIFAASVFSNAVVSVTANAGALGTYGVYLAGLGAGLNFYGNRIADISDQNPGGIAKGVSVMAASTTNIYNNCVGNISAPASASLNAVTGISVEGGSLVNVYYNTVYINTTSTATAHGSSALYTSPTVPVTLRNNILINTGTPNGPGISASYRRGTGPLNAYALSSNNNLFYAGIPSASRAVFVNGSTSYSTMSAFQAFVAPREGASVSENTPFSTTLSASPSFLHVDPLLPSLSESSASNISGITNDIDAQVRQGNLGYSGTGTAPDIGADEYDQNLPPCSSASAGIISSASPTSVCAGETIFLHSTGYSATGNIVHQWKVSVTQGGPYVNVSGGSGFNSGSYSSAALVAGSYYYVLVTTCSLGPVSHTSNEVNIQVNATPGVTISASSQTLCAGSGFSLNVSTDLGTGFLWLGPSGFISTNQNTVITSMPSTGGGIYSVVVSSGTCSATGSINILVSPMPPPFQLTSANNSICIGSSQTISASVALNSPTLTLGNQSFQNVSSGYPAPYSVYYGGQKMQILIQASELSNAGFIAGTPFSSLSFPVVSLGANWGASLQECQNFRVAMGSTSLSSLNTFQNNLTNVLSISGFTPIVGNSNTHSFLSPFVWDGVSHLVIETVFSNGIFGAAADAVIQYNSPTTFQSTLVYRADNQSVNAIAAATNSNVNVGFVRPDLILNGIQVGTYSWSPATGLSNTSGSVVVANPTITTVYTASLSNGMCTSLNSRTIHVIQIPTVNISSTAGTVCVGNSATLTAGGAQSYTWSTNSTASTIVVFPASTSTYVLVGANAPCPTASSALIIQSAPAFTFLALVTPTAVCAGESGTMTALGAMTYTWSNGNNSASIVVTPTTTSIRTVTASNGPGCWSAKILSIKVNELPTIQVLPLIDSACVGELVNFGAQGASTYTWMPGNSTNAVVSFTASGNAHYTVSGSNLNNCVNTATVQLVVSPCTGQLEIPGSGDTFKIYPNPAQDLIWFSTTEWGNKILRVYNSYGQMLCVIHTQDQTGEIDLRSFSKGVYTVELISQNGISTRKLVRH